MKKTIITDNKVILNEQGKIEFQLTEETKSLGHFSVEEGKRLGAQIIQEIQLMMANRILLQILKT